jgi:signal transduction histidine kinase
MRTVSRMILPLLVIVSAFVVIVFMLARNVRLDYATLASCLYHLKHDHAVLAKAVLRTRQGHPEDVSTIVVAKDQIVADTQRIKDLDWRDRAADTELKTLLASYSQSVDALLNDVEQFKSANAVEHNSLHYLPQLADSLTALVANESRDLPVAVDDMLRALLVHTVEDNSESRGEVVRQIQRLKSLQTTASPAAAAQLELLRSHAEKVMETLPLVDSHLGAIVSSPADQFLTEALLTVAAKDDQAVSRQHLFQLGLIVVGATLVGYVVALLWQLRLSVRELDSANQMLEDKIEKRIAELRLKNQQLFQAQKLESIGQLAAGIAHEINTPMQFVYDNLEFLSDCSDKLFNVVAAYDRNLNADGPQRSWQERSAEIARVAKEARFEHVRAETPKAICESLEGIRRVINIVRAMKEFSHPGQDEKEGLDLNNAVRSTVTITSNRWKYAAEMVLELDSDLPTLKCVPGEINQVLLNLIVNAADAIVDKIGEKGDAKGRITVRTRLEPGYFVIDVEDTGCGIPDEIRNRIFDPFFTTKDVGKGTGQGLAICYNVVVNKHNGKLDVQSSPGVGTKFTIMLRRHDNQNPVRDETETTSDESVAGEQASDHEVCELAGHI